MFGRKRIKELEKQVDDLQRRSDGYKGWYESQQKRGDLLLKLCKHGAKIGRIKHGAHCMAVQLTWGVHSKELWQPWAGDGERGMELTLLETANEWIEDLIAEQEEEDRIRGIVKKVEAERAAMASMSSTGTIPLEDE